MSNPEKIQIVENIEEHFKNSKGIYFTKYTGLSVEQATKLRDKLRENNVAYKVTKNTLTKIAAKNCGYDNIEDFLVGQIGIAYSETDPAAPAKVIKEFNEKKEDNLEVVGILFEGKRFESDQFDSLANLLTKDELFSKLLNGLQQPITKLASTLNGALTKLMYSLDSLKQTKT